MARTLLAWYKVPLTITFNININVTSVAGLTETASQLLAGAEKDGFVDWS